MISRTGEDFPPEQYGLRAYDRNVRRAAVLADQYEEKWKAFRTHCYAAASEGDVPLREWFVLAGGDQHLVKNAPMCSSWKPVFFSMSKHIHDAMADYALAAAAAGVPPDKMRAIRRQYNMLRPDWD